jgi:hypothetical protein
MGLFRIGLLGAAAYGIYRFATGSHGGSRDRRTHDGVSAIFPTREQADLAVEHLVQEFGIDRALIYVEPAADENSAGELVSGGDHASGERSSASRSDAPLHGAIEVTVPSTIERFPIIQRALRDVGARRIEAF